MQTYRHFEGMKNIYLVVLILVLSLTNCADDENINPSGLVEQNADISGDWRLANVTQNNVDITDQFDFKSLSLSFTYSSDKPATFNKTGSNSIPFAFSMVDGAFTFDDLKYPTKLIFSGSQDVSVKLGLPLVSNGNDLKLEMSLGCSNNTYVYWFKKT